LFNEFSFLLLDGFTFGLSLLHIALELPHYAPDPIGSPNGVVERPSYLRLNNPIYYQSVKEVISEGRKGADVYLNVGSRVDIAQFPLKDSHRLLNAVNRFPGSIYPRVLDGSCNQPAAQDIESSPIPCTSQRVDHPIEAGHYRVARLDRLFQFSDVGQSIGRRL
jgi:hypothetical protein